MLALKYVTCKTLAIICDCKKYNFGMWSIAGFDFFFNEKEVLHVADMATRPSAGTLSGCHGKSYELPKKKYLVSIFTVRSNDVHQMSNYKVSRPRNSSRILKVEQNYRECWDAIGTIPYAGVWFHWNLLKNARTFIDTV